jgi:hypothetical protein
MQQTLARFPASGRGIAALAVRQMSLAAISTQRQMKVILTHDANDNRDATKAAFDRSGDLHPVRDL